MSAVQKLRTDELRLVSPLDLSNGLVHGWYVQRSDFHGLVRSTVPPDVSPVLKPSEASIECGNAVVKRWLLRKQISESACNGRP